MEKQAFVRVFKHRFKNLICIRGRLNADVATEREAIDIIAESTRDVVLTDLFLHTSKFDDATFRRLVWTLPMLGAYVNSWRSKESTKYGAVRLWVSPRVKKASDNWKRFTRPMTKVDWYLYCFLLKEYYRLNSELGPAVPIIGGATLSSVEDTFEWHPAWHGINVLVGDGGSVLAMDKFLRSVGDIRGDLIQMSKKSLAPEQFMKVAGWLSDIADIKSSVRRYYQGETLTLDNQNECLVAAVLGTHMQVFSENSFVSRVANQYSRKQHAYYTAVKLGAMLLLLTWLASEYHPELFDDRIFNPYGIRYTCNGLVLD